MQNPLTGLSQLNRQHLSESKLILIPEDSSLLLQKQEKKCILVQLNNKTTTSGKQAQSELYSDQYIYLINYLKVLKGQISSLQEENYNMQEQIQIYLNHFNQIIKIAKSNIMSFIKEKIQKLQQKNQRIKTEFQKKYFLREKRIQELQEELKNAQGNLTDCQHKFENALLENEKLKQLIHKLEKNNSSREKQYLQVRQAQRSRMGPKKKKSLLSLHEYYSQEKEKEGKGEINDDIRCIKQKIKKLKHEISDHKYFS